ncbi:MAG: PQQ-binding-like beta-propeller repeat protein [Kofleriaceae bacterium]
MATTEATQVKCPECGARLDIAGDAPIVACSYCGTQSRVQRRTPILEIRKPLPKALPHEPVRIAREVRSRKGKLLLAATIIAGIGLGPGIVVGVLYHSYTTTEWEGHHLLLGDANGDGVDDFIGFDRNIVRDRMFLAAYSGVDGHRLWRSASLGGYSAVYKDTIANNSAGGIVLVADPIAHLAAYEITTGVKRWQITAPEVVAAFCFNNPGEPPTLRTADKQVWTVRATDGKLEPATECRANLSRQVLAEMHGELAGMTLQEVYTQGDGPRVAIGVRSPGTPVPMIAVLDPGGHALWKAEVAGHDPMTMKLRAGSAPAISEHDVAIVYARGKQFELVVFDRATGARRFEVPVKARTSVVSGVVLRQSFVAVETWGSLQVFDLATGTRRFIVGQ